ncbi:MAG TPA: response regulator transcription factor [Planktothrix sp.]|jgi:DNA-binding response OmpR family regulator
MAKILIVEDDKSLSGTVEKWLTFEHHLVEVVDNGEQALENLKFYKYDMVVLDINLPKVSGMDVCKQFRAGGGATPILMLTGRDAIDDKEKGLDAGADDYLTKPFHLKELSARVRALLRRPTNITGDVLKSGGLSLETATYKVLRDGEQVQLSQQEFALLEFLMRNANQVFSPEALLDRVWKSSSDVSPAAIRTHVKMLRKKIDKDGEPSFIRNIHGVGYRFDAR